MERINKYLASVGVGSRRKIDQLIEDRRIKIDGKHAIAGQKVENTSIIEIDGNVIDIKKPDFIYILLNKPKGVVTTVSDELGRRSVIDLINIKDKIYPIGRLDRNTTGVILLTNDGRLANKLMHPKSNVNKTYRVTINRMLEEADFKHISNGVVIDGEKTLPAKLSYLTKDKKVIKMTIHEGRNHQIRKIFELLDYEILALDRINYLFLTYYGLKAGEWRHLTAKEVEQLKKI